jgi:hypothetical protein
MRLIRPGNFVRMTQFINVNVYFVNDLVQIQLSQQNTRRERERERERERDRERYVHKQEKKCDRLII